MVASIYEVLGLRSDDPRYTDPRTGRLTVPDILPSGETLDALIRRNFGGIIGQGAGSPDPNTVEALTQFIPYGNNNLSERLLNSTDPGVQDIARRLQKNATLTDRFSFFGDNLFPALALLGGAVGGAALTGGGAALGAGGAGAAEAGLGAGTAASGGLGAGTTAAGVGSAGALGGGAAAAGSAGTAAGTGGLLGGGGFLGTGLTAGQALGLAGTVGSGIAGLASGGQSPEQATASGGIGSTSSAGGGNDITSQILRLQQDYANQTAPLRDQYFGGGNNGLLSFLNTGQLPPALQQQYPAIPLPTRTDQAQRQNLESQFRRADQQLLDIAGGLGGQLNAGRINLRAQRGQAATELANRQQDRLYQTQLAQQQQDLGISNQQLQQRNQLYSAGLGIASGAPAQQFGALSQAGGLQNAANAQAIGLSEFNAQQRALAAQQSAAQQGQLGQGLGASLALLGATLPNLFGGKKTSNPYLVNGFDQNTYDF